MLVSRNLKHLNFSLNLTKPTLALQERLKLEVKNRISSAELKSSDAYDYINARKPSPSQVYAAMYESGCLVWFTETVKLFKFALLVPPSTSGIECGFSVMKLIVPPLHISLIQTNIDCFIRICINSPEKLSDDELEKLVDNYKNIGNCCIHL